MDDVPVSMMEKGKPPASQSPSPGSVTVQSLLMDAFARYAMRPCVRWEGGVATYEETGHRVRATALQLQERTRPQGHVGILLPNGREYLELILACAAAGRVRVPMGHREPTSSLAQLIAGADCELLVTTPTRLEELRDVMGSDLPPSILVVGGSNPADSESLVKHPTRNGAITLANAADRYRLSFTGGTTGAAKAVVQTHQQELALIRNLLLEVYQPGTNSTFVAATPLSHASGAFVLPTVIRGGSLSWTEGFDPERLADSRWLGDGLSIQTFLVPTALDDLARAVSPGSHPLETVIYGGAPCPKNVLERATESIGLRLVQVYGQAEAPMTICMISEVEHGDPGDLAGCVGYPFLFTEVTVEVDGTRVNEPDSVGEVVVRADHVMEGYWQNPQATAESFTKDGGMRTYDLGRWDEQGRLWLVGRSREMFISGGYNVFPSEVERHLGSVQGVREMAAFGVSHRRWGEATVLAVVPTGPGVELDELRSRVELAGRQLLAPHECPKQIVFVDELPLTAVGKVSRRDLSARFQTVFAADDL